MFQRTCLLLCAVAAAVFSVPWFRVTSPVAAGGPDADKRKGDPAMATAKGHEWVGTASCAAAACHAGNGPKGAARSEYTTWAIHDPHGKGFSVLHNDKSARIAANLGRGKKAYDDALCLNCHVHPDWAGGKHGERFAKEDGVGCESCHGPAGDWVAVHYLDDWKTKKPAEKEKLGLQDTKDLLKRGQACVTCHVGAPGNDVNHDLIGAGHPRLNFEFGAYQAVLPRHWSDSEDLKRYPDLQARTWRLGQVLSAEAAVRLLAHRAEDEKLPWPEFAEYDCYACHHDLKAKSRRQSEEHYAGRMPGLLPWGGWYTAVLPQAVDASVKEPLADLKKAMQVPYPDRDAVVKHARAILRELQGLSAEIMKSPTPGPDDLLERFKKVARNGDALAAGNWDEAAQLYLALAALHHARRDAEPGKPLTDLQNTLKQMGSELRFPAGFDSPRGNFPSAALGKQLRSIQKQIRIR